MCQDCYDDDYDDEGSPECMWCGERGCPGYDCNVEDYNTPERWESSGGKL